MAVRQPPPEMKIRHENLRFTERTKNSFIFNSGARSRQRIFERTRDRPRNLSRRDDFAKRT